MKAGGGLTFAQGLLQQVVLGLQFDDEVAAIQVLLEFLDGGREKERGAELKQSSVSQTSVKKASAAALI